MLHCTIIDTHHFWSTEDATQNVSSKRHRGGESILPPVTLLFSYPWQSAASMEAQHHRVDLIGAEETATLLRRKLSLANSAQG
jgi:hypothetical protein